jgi:membrane fusion protein, multidrug efflux system
MMRHSFIAPAALALWLISIAGVAAAQGFVVEAVQVTEWKSVFGQVETRNRVDARARIGGTVVKLQVTEGDRVSAGTLVAMVVDDKLDFELASIDARLKALRARQETAQTDLTRGESLAERGIITSQRLEQLQTAVDVNRGDIDSLQSQRLIVEQQIAEGAVLAPEEGVVLAVPISRGSVVTPGDSVAIIGGGGVFLRLSVPERHAGQLQEGDSIQIGGLGGDISDGHSGTNGRLVKLFPLIEGGRVQADVEVENLDVRFVGQRMAVRLPVGVRSVILVPQEMIVRRGGMDFVMVENAAGEVVGRAVVPGRIIAHKGAEWREILTGLNVGDKVVPGDA